MEAVKVEAVEAVAVEVEALEGPGMTWTSGLCEPFYHSRAQLSRRRAGRFRPQRDRLWIDFLWNCCYPELSVAENPSTFHHLYVARSTAHAGEAGDQLPLCLLRRSSGALRASGRRKLVHRGYN